MTGEAAIERKVIACNYAVATGTACAGAKCYVLASHRGGGNDRLELLIRSRSGRWVRKWESIKRLGRFRLKTIPPAHPRYAVLQAALPEDWLAELQEAAA